MKIHPYPLMKGDEKDDEIRVYNEMDIMGRLRT
jgi:hypothetical protein